MTMRPRRETIAPLAFLLVLACSDTVAPKGPVQHLLAVDGDGQSGATLDTLPELLVVQVVDDGGEPLAGVPVTWTSEDETGRTIAVEPVTNHEGVARAIAVLGFSDGSQRFHARADAFDEVATFELTAVRGPALKAVSLMNASGSDHMCALDQEGRAWCWGSNSSGQLGNGTTEWSDEARPVLTAQRFRSIAGSDGVTCAIALDDSLWCWGRNESSFGGGRFGNGNVEPSSVPVLAGTGLSVTDIDIDGALACAVSTAGEAWCWGSIITPTGNATSLLPVKVESAQRWRDISVSGSDRVCAVSLDYEVYCWANGTSAAQRAGLAGDFSSPSRPQGIPPVVDVSVSWWNQCGRLVSGSGAVCWGHNLNGGTTLDPVQYPTLNGSGISQVRVRAETGMALGTDGGLRIWGQPPHCCDGFISAVPVPLAPRGPWLDFALGSGAFGILAADSTVHHWYPFPGFGPPTGLVPRPVRVLEQDPATSRQGR